MWSVECAAFASALVLNALISLPVPTTFRKSMPQCAAESPMVRSSPSCFAMRTCAPCRRRRRRRRSTRTPSSFPSFAPARRSSTPSWPKPARSPAQRCRRAWKSLQIRDSCLPLTPSRSRRGRYGDSERRQYSLTTKARARLFNETALEINADATARRFAPRRRRHPAVGCCQRPGSRRF
jgi:hypothetical protein